LSRTRGTGENRDPWSVRARANASKCGTSVHELRSASLLGRDGRHVRPEPHRRTYVAGISDPKSKENSGSRTRAVASVSNPHLPRPPQPTAGWSRRVRRPNRATHRSLRRPSTRRHWRRPPAFSTVGGSRRRNVSDGVERWCQRGPRASCDRLPRPRSRWASREARVASQLSAKSSWAKPGLSCMEANGSS
jgi:hypothetical protein